MVSLNGNPLKWDAMTPTEDIITQRLQIHPLSDADFSALMKGFDKLEIQMGITVTGEEPNGDFQVAIQWLALQMVVHPDEFPWWTVWHIRLRDEERTVGCLCFKGAPDDSGGVEIAQAFVYPQYFDQGIMTEAAGAVTDWALRQDGVLYVMVETDNWNLPAQRVLEKIGYGCYNKTENSKFYWKCKDKPAE